MLNFFELLPILSLIGGLMTWASLIFGPLDTMQSIWSDEYHFHRCGSLTAAAANLNLVAESMMVAGHNVSLLREAATLWATDFDSQSDCANARSQIELFRQSSSIGSVDIPNTFYRRVER